MIIIAHEKKRVNIKFIVIRRFFMNSTTPSTRPRMLTIRETARTGVLPETALRRLVKQDKIPGIYVGTRFLVNFDKLCEELDDRKVKKQ